MSKFLNYLNPFTQSNKIYSEDDLMSMSINDIVNNKEEIIAQKGIIGIPKQAELSSSQNAVYVNGYTKSDGTVVKPHWRSRSGGGVNSIIQGVLKEISQGASGGAVQDGISQIAQNVSGKSAQPQDFVTAALPVQNSQNLNVPDTFSLEQNSQTQSAPINANGIDGSTWNVLENTTPDFGNTNTYQTIPNEPDYSNMNEEDIILNTAKVVQHSLLNNPYAKSRFSEREWNAIENLINCDGRLDVWMMKELDPYESRIKRIDEFDSPEVVKDILKYCVKRPTLDEMNKKINDFIDWSKQFKNKPANTNPQNISGSVSDMQNISDYSNIQGSPTGFAAPVQNKNTSMSSDIFNEIKDYNSKYRPQISYDGKIWKYTYDINQKLSKSQNMKFLNSKLNSININMNKTDTDAQYLMELSLSSPEKLVNSSECIVANFADKALLMKSNIYFSNDKPVLIFNSQGILANSLLKSKDLKKCLKNWNEYAEINNEIRPKEFPVILSDTSNLTKSIHGATIRNIKSNKDGTISFYLTDFYDFRFLPFNTPNLKTKTILTNNTAYALQKCHLIKNYNIVVPLTINIRELKF